jgi:hypothetical protein
MKDKRFTAEAPIDSDVANDPPSSANPAVPAGFAWLLSRAKGALTT